MKTELVEAAYFEYLTSLFAEARDSGQGGEMSIVVRAIGGLNDGALPKIEVTVEVGDWSTQGKMTAKSTDVAFDLACVRNKQNVFHEAKRISHRVST